FAGPLDGNGRRSIYLKMSIMDPPKFLVGFNLPDLKLPSGKRDETNVPTQALVLLNDPLVKELSRQWASAELTRQADDTTRLRSMFLKGFGRPPTSDEAERWLTAFAPGETKEGRFSTALDRWTEIAHTIFNTKEFIYYR
ncbi:MAG: DUF1553 domain-containing protein, partial [Verrucomicrobiae bacterium]|nr:DUF1553 domain-containing protein [Verrucomicrobiae bacterium]